MIKTTQNVNGKVLRYIKITDSERKPPMILDMEYFLKDEGNEDWVKEIKLVMKQRLVYGFFPSQKGEEIVIMVALSNTDGSFDFNDFVWGQDYYQNLIKP